MQLKYIHKLTMTYIPESTCGCKTLPDFSQIAAADYSKYVCLMMVYFYHLL